MNDPVVLLVMVTLGLLILVTHFVTRPKGERRQPRRQPGTEVYCFCGARAEVGDKCKRHAWDRGRV